MVSLSFALRALWIIYILGILLDWISLLVDLTGGISGLLFGSPNAEDGDYIETSPILTGSIENGFVVTTSSCLYPLTLYNVFLRFFKMISNFRCLMSQTQLRNAFI